MQPVNENPSTCAAPALVRHAYRMYGHVSSLSYGLPLQVLQPRYATRLGKMFPNAKHIPGTQYHRLNPNPLCKTDRDQLIKNGIVDTDVWGFFCSIKS